MFVVPLAFVPPDDADADDDEAEEVEESSEDASDRSESALSEAASGCALDKRPSLNLSQTHHLRWRRCPEAAHPPAPAAREASEI